MLTLKTFNVGKQACTTAQNVGQFMQLTHHTGKHLDKTRHLPNNSSDSAT